jgi:hypothetical protein
MQKVDEEYIPRDDESEAARVRDLTGVGEEIHYVAPVEVSSFNLADFGLGLEEIESQ